jgi:hypothetical protein
MAVLSVNLEGAGLIRWRDAHRSSLTGVAIETTLVRKRVKRAKLLRDNDYAVCPFGNACVA